MLPDDMRAYLRDEAQRTMRLAGGEVTEVTFFAPEVMELKPFDVHSWTLHNQGHLKVDPDEDRIYEGYDLIADCGEHYSPEGILIWFPEWRQYGTWDCDHHTIITYPDVTWAEIAADPTWYINGQWRPERVKHHVVNPWA
jgi:hypothetical protein